MNFEIGVDILSNKKVAILWKNHASRIREVVLAPREVQEMESRGMQFSSRPTERLNFWQMRYLATRFAAKEASLKVLEFDTGITYELKDIEVLGDRKLTIHLIGALESYAQQNGSARLIGSCSATRELTLAVVAREKCYE